MHKEKERKTGEIMDKAEAHGAPHYERLKTYRLQGVLLLLRVVLLASGYYWAQVTTRYKPDGELGGA